MNAPETNHISVESLFTPVVLVDRLRVEANVWSMQAACDAAGVELRPHVKTHKMVAVARLQLGAGARGLTCAKLGEAEAMLPSGVNSLFIAHSLVDSRLGPRLAALSERVKDLRVGTSSPAQAAALAGLAAAAGVQLRVMMAIDTGLRREGARDAAAAMALAVEVSRHPRLELAGFYTHEGHFYGVPPAEVPARLAEFVENMTSLRDSIDRSLPLWPGCSVTALRLAATGGIQAVRPGAYVFGDLSLSRGAGVMKPENVALTVLATVVDRPEPGLALIDAGSKSFSSDRTPDGIFGLAADGRDIGVARVNEEHGYLRGKDVDSLRVGDRLAFVPAHVCTVVNLADEVRVIEGNRVVDTWVVDGRGRTS